MKNFAFMAGNSYILDFFSVKCRSLLVYTSYICDDEIHKMKY